MFWKEARPAAHAHRLLSRGIHKLEAVIIAALPAAAAAASAASASASAVPFTPHARVCPRGPPALVGQNLERHYLARRACTRASGQR